MRDITEEIALTEDQLLNDEIEQEIPEPSMSVDDFVELVANLMVTIRKVPDEYREQWISKYIALNSTLLKLISFDKAIGLLQISNIDPKTSLVIGLGILAGSAFFIRIPTSFEEYSPKETKKISEKVKTEKKNYNDEIQKILKEMNEKEET